MSRQINFADSQVQRTLLVERKVQCLESFLIETPQQLIAVLRPLLSTGVSKLRPAGQIRPAKAFHPVAQAFC